METRPRPLAGAGRPVAVGGDGSREARMGPGPTRTRCDTPATALLCRVRPLTKGHRRSELRSSPPLPLLSPAVRRHCVAQWCGECLLYADSGRGLTTTKTIGLLPLWRGAGGGGLLAGTRRRPAAEDGVPPTLQIPSDPTRPLTGDTVV
jgi:hypothetical protein